MALTGSLCLGPLISLLDAMAEDVEFAHLASPLPLRLLGRQPVFPPPILDPLGDHFLGVRHYNVLEVGCCDPSAVIHGSRGRESTHQSSQCPPSGQARNKRESREPTAPGRFRPRSSHTPSTAFLASGSAKATLRLAHSRSSVLLQQPAGAEKNERGAAA